MLSIPGSSALTTSVAAPPARPKGRLMRRKNCPREWNKARKKIPYTSDSDRDGRQMRRQKSEDIFGINRLTECLCIMHPGPAALAHKGNAGLTCKSFTTTRPVYSPWTRAQLTGGGWLAATSRSRNCNWANLLIHEENILFKRKKKIALTYRRFVATLYATNAAVGAPDEGRNPWEPPGRPTWWAPPGRPVRPVPLIFLLPLFNPAETKRLD